MNESVTPSVVSCDSGYHTEDNFTCISNTKATSCTGLPSSAVWNTVSSINQTWNGSSWTPTVAGTYNITSSTTNCNYKCGAGTVWNGGACISPSATIQTAYVNGGDMVTNCGITDNASTCSATISWTISNATSPNIYNATTGVTYSTSPSSGGNILVSINYGSNTIYARDGSSVLAQVTTKAVCYYNSGPTMWGDRGTFWNGSICEPSWIAKTAMPTARGNASAATASNNKIYIFGGVNASSAITGVTEEYNPSTNTWATKTAMPTPRSNTVAVAVGNIIYVMG